MRNLRLYLDTSVFGGCFDAEFQAASRKLIDEVLAGKFSLVLSTTTLEELEGAPPDVQELLRKLKDQPLETIVRDAEIEALRDAYVEEKIVGPASLLDAEHIASASVAAVDLIVSWNFKHIVHFDKIRGNHGVNLLRGYRSIPIHTPEEVIEQ